MDSSVNIGPDSERTTLTIGTHFFFSFVAYGDRPEEGMIVLSISGLAGIIKGGFMHLPPALFGERLELVPAIVEYAEDVLRVIDAEHSKNLLFFQDKPTLERERAYLARMEESKLDALFLIMTSDNTILGTVGLHEIDTYHRTARFGILVFQTESRGQRYGSEAIDILLRFAFKELGLNKVYGKVFATNPRNIGIYTRLGFLPEGVLRQEYLLGGTFHDMVYISMLRSDWDRLQAEVKESV